MHGEYKVPGGKLVVVDFDVVGDVIRNPRVAGDFFLEPDEALGDINAALDGLAAASDGRRPTPGDQSTANRSSSQRMRSARTSSWLSSLKSSWRAPS